MSKTWFFVVLVVLFGLLGLQTARPVRADSGTTVIDRPEIRDVVVDLGIAQVRERPEIFLESPWVVSSGEITVGPTGDVRTIADALELAVPGTTIQLELGEHPGPVQTVRSGTPEAPIIVSGPGRIVGDGDGRLVSITHDHVWLVDLEITRADTLVWVENATGVRVIGSEIHDARSECIRLKFFAQHNTIAGNSIHTCGTADFDLDRNRKNGEGVYIGTAPEQLDKNPDERPDRSDHNRVHDNRFDVPAECVDVKEAATANVIENNECAGGRDPDGAGFSSRGQGTVFRTNRSTGHAGAGIRLGGDGDQDGIGSVVEHNVLTGNAGYGLKVLRNSQASMCGNELADNGDGPTKQADGAAEPCG